jgi:undecaprenyl-diphosphatase
VVEHRAGSLDPIFVALSVIGYAGIVWIALAPILAHWERRPLLRVTALTAICVWSADIVATLLKLAIDRPRPYETVAEADPLLETIVASSLPSGHAATSFAGAVALTVLVGRLVPALFVLALAIAYSRIYVGVHYPGDVLAGAALGAAISLLVLAAAGLRFPRRTSGGRRRSFPEQPPG